MIPVTTFAGKRVAVFGLGSSGLASAHALTAGGAQVICYDDKRERTEAANNAGLPTGDLRVADFAAFDALLLAPGVPLTHPAPHWSVERAQAAGIEVIGDIELFERERRARFGDMKLAAITGTNGKSTVTALTGHLLKAMGVAAQIGGNIGRPVLDFDPKATDAVVEVSSYQIDLAPTLSPDVGALLNVTVDHIDRHGSFENYVAVKERVVARSATAVLGEGELLTEIARRHADIGPRLLAFGAVETGSAEEAFRADIFEAGVFAHAVAAGWEFMALDRRGERPLGAIGDIASLRGAHNALNVAAALAIVEGLGHDPARAAEHLATFPGLPHRMEEVGRDGAVTFINDSKATNLISAIIALKSFGRIHWIAGGKPKEGGLTELHPERFDIRRAYLIGEAAEDFARTLSGAVDTRLCGTLEAALDAAAEGARADGGGVVLLSPACASFDQFRSFEERGDIFRTLVRQRMEAANG